MNIEKIRNVAKLFLDIEPEPDKQLPEIIVHHPFFNQSYLPKVDKTETNFVFHYTDKIEFEKWKDKIRECIDKYDVNGIFMLLNSAYYMNFMVFIDEFLDDKELAHVLRNVWVQQEFPNYNSREDLSQILQMFKRASNYIMEEDEKEIYNSLPDEVTIYRGQSQGSRYYKALSWTLNKDKAFWFAKRFTEDRTPNIVYEAKVNKKDILAVLNNRNEMEVIVDYNKIRNRKSI